MSQLFKCYAECHYAEWRYAECRYTECRYAEYHYAECRYAECRYAECRNAEGFGAKILYCLMPCLECSLLSEQLRKSLNISRYLLHWMCSTWVGSEMLDWEANVSADQKMFYWTGPTNEEFKRGRLQDEEGCNVFLSTCRFLK